MVLRVLNHEDYSLYLSLLRALYISEDKLALMDTHS